MTTYKTCRTCRHFTFGKCGLSEDNFNMKITSNKDYLQKQLEDGIIQESVEEILGSHKIDTSDAEKMEEITDEIFELLKSIVNRCDETIELEVIDKINFSCSCYE